MTPEPVQAAGSIPARSARDRRRSRVVLRSPERSGFVWWRTSGLAVRSSGAASEPGSAGRARRRPPAPLRQPGLAEAELRSDGPSQRGTRPHGARPGPRPESLRSPGTRRTRGTGRACGAFRPAGRTTDERRRGRSCSRDRAGTGSASEAALDHPDRTPQPWPGHPGAIRNLRSHGAGSLRHRQGPGPRLSRRSSAPRSTAAPELRWGGRAGKPARSSGHLVRLSRGLRSAIGRRGWSGLLAIRLPTSRFGRKSWRLLGRLEGLHRDRPRRSGKAHAHSPSFVVSGIRPTTSNRGPPCASIPGTPRCSS